MAKHSIAKSKLGAPKLESLSPTDESFFQNLKQCHLQITVWRWRCSLNSDPPTVCIFFYGFGKNGETKYLIPFASCFRCFFASTGNNEGVQI